MHNLRKQLSFLLLSGFAVLTSSKAFAGYTNPFIPIYVKGDDISQAAVKPSVIYEESKNSKIIIPNMPAYKTQDELGECRAFSLATVVQKYTCDKWRKEIPDCKNPPPDSAISYFGMLAHTNRSVEQSETFQPNQENARSMYDIVNDLSKNGSQLILESCKPFDNLVNKFSSGQDHAEKKEKFFNYLKDLYKNKKSITEANITDCPECLAQINNASGLNANLANLKKALTQSTYDKFLYTLFFDGCEMESFPSGFRARAYPFDDMNVAPGDIKKQVIEGLKQGKPVLFPTLCISGNSGEECQMSHSTVISGYKRVCEVGKPSRCKDVLKVHNSWGASWQKKNNDGWVEADAFVQNTTKVKLGSTYRLSSGSVIWLDP